MLTDSDRLDILEIVARADNAATRRDAVAYVSFFTDEAILDGEKGEHRGREQLRQSVGPIWESEGSRSTHPTMNIVIEGVEDHPDRAVATSLLMILGHEPALSIESLSFITQQFVRADSRWLIERRSVRSAPDSTTPFSS